MSFSPFDLNQGAYNRKKPRQSCPSISIVLYHPDYDRRLRDLTGSADPKDAYPKALAGFAHRAYRRWGIAPRPENIMPYRPSVTLMRGYKMYQIRARVMVSLGQGPNIRLD